MYSKTQGMCTNIRLPGPQEGDFDTQKDGEGVHNIFYHTLIGAPCLFKEVKVIPQVHVFNMRLV